MSLVDFLNQMEESEAEFEKQAAEEEAAGRIMARGFMDELDKIAGPIDWLKRKFGFGQKKPVPAPQPKFKPGSGYKPAPTFAPKKPLKPTVTGGRTRAARDVSKYMP